MTELIKQHEADRETDGRMAGPRQPNLRFIHLPTGLEAPSVWKQLHETNFWRKAQFDNHEANSLSGAADRTGYRPVLTDWLALETGQIWCTQTKQAIDPVHIPVDGKESLSRFVDASRAFFSRFEGRKIGVQLSGGVDSSLIIGLLRHLGIRHGLVGLKSDRYEFRTERVIQERLAEQNYETELIDEATCLPCSGLNQVPPHQIPDLLSLNLAQDRMMAEACQRLNIEVLLSGGGGDTLLGQAVHSDPQSCTWRPQTFIDPFPVDVAYAPRGIEFCSFFDNREIVDAIWCLRRGQRDDQRKLWARNYFRAFLPRELVDFQYRADFWGRYIDGLAKAYDKIREIHARAFEITGNSYFDPVKLEALLSQDIYRPRKEFYQRIESRASSAVWICSLAGWLAEDATGSEPRRTRLDSVSE